MTSLKRDLVGKYLRGVQGENAVRHSGVPFAVVRPTALTEEPAGAELQVDQGDTIKVRQQCSSQSIAVDVRGSGVTGCWGELNLAVSGVNFAGC